MRGAGRARHRFWKRVASVTAHGLLELELVPVLLLPSPTASVANSSSAWDASTRVMPPSISSRYACTGARAYFGFRSALAFEVWVMRYLLEHWICVFVSVTLSRIAP